MLEPPLCFPIPFLFFPSHAPKFIPLYPSCLCSCFLWLSTYLLCCAKSFQSSPPLDDAMDCGPPGSSVPGILQARILERVAISISRGFSQPRDLTSLLCLLYWRVGSLPLAAMSGSNCCFLTCIQVSREAGKVVWYSHLLKNFSVCCNPHCKRLQHSQ